MRGRGTGAARRRRRTIVALAAAVCASAAVLTAIALLREGPAGRTGPSLSPSAISSAKPSTPTGTGRPAAASPMPGTLRGLPVVAATDYGADGGDTSDDTAAVEAAVRAVAGRDVVLYFPPGTYELGDLTVPGGVRLAGAGAAFTWLRGAIEMGGDCRMTDLKAGIAGRAFRFVPGATRTTLDRVEFVGGGSMTSGEDQGVIRFSAGRSASFILFRDCVIGANSADGNGVSIVDNGWSGATYHDLTWQRCTFRGSPRMSLECIQREDGSHEPTTGYRAIDLIDCVFRPSGSETVSYDAVRDAGYSLISGCTFEGAGWNEAYPWGQGVEFNRTREMVFTGNTVYRCREAMINHSGELGVTTGTVFRDNVFDTRTSSIPQVPTRPVQVIYFNQVSGARFSGNQVTGDVGGELAYISRSSGNRFTGNRFTDLRPGVSAFACVKLTDGSTDNHFARDTFRTSSPQGALILQDGSPGNAITDCVFFTGGRPAVTAEPGSEPVLRGNVYR